MAHVIYRCPRTGHRVQGWLAEEPTPDDHTDTYTYTTVTCATCGQVHLLNAKTGKALGSD